jgi:signal transduction histidine kinase/ligand-binding sensor domain-containing protein
MLSDRLSEHRSTGMKRAFALLLHGLALASNLALAAEGASRGASQLDPNLAISQYAHTAWRVEDGAFDGAPNAITQTPDGYLWIGTDAGVVRFDGVRFVRWTPPMETRALSVAVYSLLGTRDGSLWIGTMRSVVRWDRGSGLQQFPELLGRFNALLEGSDGAVWAARSRLAGTMPGPVCRVTSSGVRCFGAADGIACPNAVAAIRDQQGDLWFGGSNALCRWNEAGSRIFLQKELTATGGLEGITSLASASDGSIWVGIGRSGGGLGLVHLRDGTAQPDIMPGFDASRIEVTALLVDRDDSVWIGARGNGIYRIRGRTVDHFGTSDGLSSDSIRGFYQDREGSVWVVTSRGVDRFRGFHVVSYSVRQGLPSDNVHSVLAASDGTIWMGMQGALGRLRDGIASSLSSRDGLPGKSTTALFEDRAHRLWVGVDDGLAVYENNTFRSVPSDDQQPLGIVTAMTQDADGSMWVQLQGTRAGLLHIVDGMVRERTPAAKIPVAFDLQPDPDGGIWMALRTGVLGHVRQGTLQTFPLGGSPVRVQALHVSADRSVWIATLEGLFHWKSGVVTRLDRTNGLPCDSIFALAPDGSGGLWLYARCGVIRLSAADLGKWSAQPDVMVAPHVFDPLDGALPAIATFAPRASTSPDGRVWFANDSVLQMIDRDRLPDQAMTMEVHVEQIVADRRTYAAIDGLRLAARTRDLQIDYTVPSFAVPEKIRFRYRLDGEDPDWQEPGTRRQAFYNDLGPGTYRFHVIASNADGIWNAQGASLQFTIAPAYYQTLWFRSTAVALFAGLLCAGYVLHMRRVTAGIADRMEARLTERERIARELHDTVLQGAYGVILRFQAVAERMPPSDPTRVTIEDTLSRAEQVVAEGRRRVDGLRTQSDDGSGLQAALAAVGKEVVSSAHADVTVISEGRSRALHTIVRDEVYWIAREAIVNALRSAHATRVEVELSYRRANLCVRVRDDGRGIDPAVLEAGGRAGHWGLRGMKERARRIGAAFDIWTGADVGTEVSLTIQAAVAYREPAARSHRWWTRWSIGRSSSTSTELE